MVIPAKKNYASYLQRLSSLIVVDQLLFRLFVVAINDIIAISSLACALSSLRTCLALCACCALSCLSLLINLCEELLRAVHEFLFRCLDLLDLGVCHLLCRSFVDRFLEGIQVSLNSGLIVCIDLIANFFHCLLCLEYHGISFVSCIDRFFLLLILSLVSCSLLNSLIDIILGHIGSGCDGDVLLFACAKVLSGYIYDTICIDIEGNFDLRNTSSCRKDTVKTELSKSLVVSCELTLTLYNVDIYGCLVISSCGEDLALLCRDGCVSLDQLCSNAAHCLDGKGKRSYIEKKDVTCTGIAC